MQTEHLRSLVTTNKEGLNFVPYLAHTPTPPSSGRRRLSASSRRSLISLDKRAVGYNGNYEGDTSMFGQQLKCKTPPHSSRMDLIDTDSDTEYKNELEMYHVKDTSTACRRTRLRRLWQQQIERLVSPEQLALLTVYWGQFQNSVYYQKLAQLLLMGRTLLLWLVHLLLLGVTRASEWSNGLWRCKTGLRNVSRRLLWCMTLAKCGDVYLFALILITSPLLFVVAVFGFLIALYCASKEWLGRCGLFMRLAL